MENNENEITYVKVIGFGELGKKVEDIISEEYLSDEENFGIEMTMFDTSNSIVDVGLLLEGVDLLILVADPSEFNDFQKLIISKAREKDILSLCMTSRSRLYSMKEEEFYTGILDCGIDSLFTFYMNTKSTGDGNEMIPYEKKALEERIACSIHALVSMVNIPQAINLDFDDLRTILKDGGMAQIGLGYSSGEKKGSEATAMAMDPYNNAWDMTEATNFLINVVGDISLMDGSLAADYIREHTLEEANIIFGACYDDKYEDACRILIIASKFIQRPVKVNSLKRQYEWLWQ
jgi:cell division protein FtsZ